MATALQNLGLICSAFVGAGLLYWAADLSARYNAWTTSLRARYSHINPPPTPEWRGRNTQVMAWMIRFVGLVLLLISVLALVRDEF